VHLEGQASAVEFDLVVPSKRVDESVRSNGGVFSAEPLLLGDLN